MKNILLIILAFNGLSLNLIAQPAEKIDESRISQPKVLAMLKDMDLRNTNDFSQLLASCYLPADSASYSVHQMTFVIKAGMEEVWNEYKCIHPRNAWNGKIVSFGLMYSKNQNTFSYLDDAYSGVEEGQIIFLNLRLFGGLLNVAVAHEIQEVNDSTHTIRFCYLANGKSEGSQTISLLPTADGYTKVNHHTLYRSGSRFRDKHLYPGLHEKAINDFHGNVIKSLEVKHPTQIMIKD